MYGYIYKTTNLINGLIYIGQKHADHFIKNYFGSCKLIKLAIKKEGIENFKVELLEEITSADDIDNREIYWISYYNATDRNYGYNISDGGKVNRAMSGKNNPNYGKHWDKEHREHQSKILKEKYANKEILPPNLGKTWSQESKLKMKAHMPDFKGKNNPMYGKHLTEEQRRKISMACKGKESPIKNKIKVNNKIKSIFIDKKDLEKYLAMGYELGPTPQEIAGRTGKKSNSSLCRKIKCLETGEIFDSMSAVLAVYNFS